MEVYTIAQEGQQLLIHSEVSGAPENQDWDAYLLNGIFSRERGNAQYLIRKKGASLTNVERFSNMPLVFFEEAHKAIETSDVHLNGLSVMVSKLDLTEGNGAPILHQHQIQSDSSSKDDEVTLEVKKNDSQKGSVPFL